MHRVQAKRQVDTAFLAEALQFGLYNVFYDHAITIMRAGTCMCRHVLLRDFQQRLSESRCPPLELGFLVLDFAAVPPVNVNICEVSLDCNFPFVQQSVGFDTVTIGR